METEQKNIFQLHPASDNWRILVPLKIEYGSRNKIKLPILI